MNQLNQPRYKVLGQVVSGKQEGRVVGYPTANLRLRPSSDRPTAGIYVCLVQWKESDPRAGLLVSGVEWEGPDKPRVEVHILDWHGDLYGEELIVEVGHKIRGIIITATLDELRQQIESDVRIAKQFFGI